MQDQAIAGRPAEGNGDGSDGAATLAQSQLEALRREIERWNVLAGGDRGLLEALLHHSPHGIFVSDPMGKFILQNRAAERIWAGSATLHSVEGWGQYRAFHPDGRPYGPTDWSMSRCLSNREIITAEEVHFQRFDGTHGILLGSCAPIWDGRGEIEGAVAVFADITALKEVEERLHIITDSLPVLISYVDVSQRYRFANLGHEQWFGKSRGAFPDQHVRDVLGREAYAAFEPRIERSLRGETVTFEAHLGHSDGGERTVEAMFIPHFGPDRSVLGFVALVSDITERRRLEQARAQWAARTERLLRITAALADAVSPEQVTEAVVDHTAAVLGAASCGLWLIADDGRTARLERCVGYAEERRARFSRIALGAAGDLPVIDALRTGDPVWIQAAGRTVVLGGGGGGNGADATVAVACLPMTVEGRTIGALMFTFEAAAAPAEEDRALVLVVAQHCAQALERIRVLYQAQLAHAETELLYRLTDAVNRAQSVGDVYDASLDTIRRSLGVERAAILFFDGEKVMRFEAWRNLSAEYRAAVEGHTPWGHEDADPQPVYVEDAAGDPAWSVYAPLFRAEGIGALGFVPLVYEGRLLGKFMVYWDEARAFTDREKSVARSIADQVASAVGRKRAQQERENLIEQLSQTVRLNELFVGVVGHDLRQPLSAVVSTAQLALRRDEEGRMARPLTRILSATERMTRMIEQLLDFTRTRVGGGIPLNPKEMDLGALVRRVLDEIEDAHPERSIALDLSGELDGHWDEDRLAQVISNLAGNALGHGAAGAPVKVHVDGSAAEAVVLRIWNAGTVRAEMSPVLFEPFRGTGFRRDMAKGLGLGLYITRQIVEAHGGEIDVASSEPDGTTFTTTLPRRAAAPSRR